MQAVIVSVVGTVGVVLAALIQSGRKENKTDHAFVVLTMLRLENKIDEHIGNHNQ
jgi:hypothetical protein